MALKHPETAHWRDSARQAKFFFLSAYATLPFLVFLLHITLWTFLIALFSCCFFALLERFGFTVPVFFRWLKVFLGGKYRYAKPWR